MEDVMETVPEQPEETMEDSSPPVSLSRAESPPHSPSKKSSPPAKSFHHSVQHRLSPIRRPLTTYTALGSPIHPRHRTHSLGSLPGAAWNGGAPSPVVGPYSPGALSPVTGHHATNIANSSIPLLPPEPSETQRAMEAAVAKERERAKSLEEEELNMTADELRAVLKRERHRTGRIAADLAAMKATAVHAQLEAEVIEEGRINGLMRRLDTLQQEKGRIIVELEREEEMLTNTLQKKLNEVRQEKAVLEHQIEREKKAHALLQSQLSDIRNTQLSVAEALEEEDEMEEEG